MKKLGDIITDVRDGKECTHEELRYAVCALCALATFSDKAIRDLARREPDSARSKAGSAWQAYSENFYRNQRAMEKDPKEWIGWDNDPDNPEFLARRKSAIALLDKIAQDAKEGE